jgi:hypothetical protein
MGLGARRSVKVTGSASRRAEASIAVAWKLDSVRRAIASFGEAMIVPTPRREPTYGKNVTSRRGGGR